MATTDIPNPEETSHPEEPYHTTDSGAVTNAPMQKPKYVPLFFLRTCMLILTWCVTGTAIGLGFWATNLAIRNQNTLLSAFQAPAVVWVSVHDIYTSAIITTVGFCILWVILTFAVIVSLCFAKEPHRFRGFGFMIIALSFWILISGAAETWYFARTGTSLYVSINNVQISQSDVDAILVAAGIPVRYKNSTPWRVTIAFVWITFFMAVATAIVLFAADGDAKHSIKKRNAAMAANAARQTSAIEQGSTTNPELGRNASLDHPPPRSPLREKNEGRDNGIEEVPIGTNVAGTTGEGHGDDEGD